MSVDTTTLGPNSIIRNTVTNRNTIAPVLYSICVNNNATIQFTENGEEHEVNSTDVYQAVCLQNGQPVSSSATSSVALCVGPDTAEKALEWLQHLNLLEVGRIVLMQFYLTAISSGNILLANTVISSTHDHVEIQVDGLNGSDSAELFAAGRCPGGRALVEVSCVSNTSGAEKVVFNILSGADAQSCQR